MDNESSEYLTINNDTVREILTLSTIFTEIKNDWAFALLTIPLLTIFGNALVIISVIRFRFLHSRINYFILHLAVADLLVALIVMPFAVYVEIHSGEWRLGPFACNFYSAADVTCSTASILLLLAISFDRFQAATRPLDYAAPKPLRNIVLGIIGAWVVSLLIATPIILGANEAPNSENECRFYNADWIIYSSLGSFLIPCLIMFVLYVRIFQVLAERHRFHKKRQGTRKPLEQPECVQEELERLTSAAATESAIDQPQQPQTLAQYHFHPLLVCNSGLPSGLSDYELPKSFSVSSIDSSCSLNRKLVEETGKASASAGATIFCNDSTTLSLSALSISFAANDPVSFIDDDTPADEEAKEITILENPEHSIDLPDTKEVEPESAQILVVCNNYQAHRQQNGATTDAEKQPIAVFTTVTIETPPVIRRRSTLSAVWTSIFSRKPTSTSITTSSTTAASQQPSGSIRTQLISAIRRKSNRRKSSKPVKATSREKKATKTLAIVLAVFLVCWVPFFTTNILNAICMKLKADACQVGFLPFFLTTWLGYMNSFMNPIIYTIFSTDFRRAFRMLLECKSEQSYQAIIIQRTGSSNSN